MVGLKGNKNRRTTKTAKTAMAARASDSSGNTRRRLLQSLAVLGTIALVAGLWRAKQSATASSEFRVAALEVRGLRLLSGNNVLQQSGVAVGDGLFQEI